jgi:transcriptional regulator with XRE-family HTH domain
MCAQQARTVRDYTTMLLGERLREIRDAKGLSQGDIQARSGLLCCYLSRIENGHTIPALDTLEKWTKALKIPLYQLFYGEPSSIVQEKESDFPHDKSELQLRKFAKAFGRMSERDRNILFAVARRMAAIKTHKR